MNFNAYSLGCYHNGKLKMMLALAYLWTFLDAFYFLFGHWATQGGGGGVYRSPYHKPLHTCCCLEAGRLPFVVGMRSNATRTTGHRVLLDGHVF